MKIIELNRPAVSRRLALKELSIKPFVSNEQYMTRSRIIQQASIKEPVWRLCKDYSVDGIEFALNLLTDQKDMKKAEKFMDKVAKSVTREQAVEYTHSRNPYIYLNEYLESK